MKKFISATLDHAAVGSGQRLFFVLSEGKKWTTLFCPSSLRRFRIHPEKLFRVEEVAVNKPSSGNFSRRRRRTSGGGNGDFPGRWSTPSSRSCRDEHRGISFGTAMFMAGIASVYAIILILFAVSA